MLKYLVLDVDGTLTDSGIYYDENGNEIKKFNTKDGAGIQVACAAGLKIVALTGRESAATLRRMTELGAAVIEQNVKNKVGWLTVFITENSISRQQIGYIGDDVNDIPSMKLCGWVGCPADSCKEVKEIANYVSPMLGGHGAVRDCIENLFSERWATLIEQVWGIVG